MKKTSVFLAFLMIGLGAAAFAAGDACQKCKQDAAQQLKTCLEKAPGEKARQVCRNRAKDEQQKCADGVCKVAGK
jgi:hypothetical protein